MSRLDAETLYDFAYTTGELYDKHVALAKRKANQNSWYLHIREHVEPLACKQLKMSKALASQVVKAAHALKEHYDKHVAECY